MDVVFAYSTNGGGAWTTKTYTVLEHRLSVLPEKVIEQEFDEAQELRKVFKGRPKILLRLDFTQFDPEQNANAEADLNWLEDWLRKPLLRISTGADVFGRSYFTSPTNSNFVTLAEDETEPDKQNRRIKFLDLTLITLRTVA